MLVWIAGDSERSEESAQDTEATLHVSGCGNGSLLAAYVAARMPRQDSWWDLVLLPADALAFATAGRLVIWWH